MNLEILYEDNHLIVARKPVGILSQEDITGDIDMLTLLKQYLKDKYQKPGNVYLGLVHRLDRMTGGVMVFARTSKAASRLNEQIKAGEFIKKYYAITNGIVPSEGVFTDYLIKDEKEVKSYVGNKNNGKLASLSYKLVKTIDNTSLVNIKLETGRHHQIRVQFSHRGYPLLGDSLYGDNHKVDLCLFAYHLEFNHPTKNEHLEFNILPNEKIWSKYFN